MDFSVTIYNRLGNSYVCRLEFEYDNFLQRTVIDGGYWRAVPEVFNISSGRFAHRESLGGTPGKDDWLDVADTTSYYGHEAPGRRKVVQLDDFPRKPRPGDAGTGSLRGQGVWVITGHQGAHLRWVVRTVDGQVLLFPSRSR